MDNVQTRRDNLKLWFARQTLPEKEKSYLSQLINGKASFGEKAARRIERDYGMPQFYLDTVHDKSEHVSIAMQADAEDSGILIEQYHDARGSMGGGLLLRDQPGQITGWKVTKEWISKNVPHNTGDSNLRIVTGFGDSMRGMFNSGDPLLVDVGVKSVEYDGVYFFRVGEEGFIKRLQRIPGEGIRVISKNEDYETWTIKEGMDFEVFARVLKVWQSEDF